MGCGASSSVSILQKAEAKTVQVPLDECCKAIGRRWNECVGPNTTLSLSTCFPIATPFRDHTSIELYELILCSRILDLQHIVRHLLHTIPSTKNEPRKDDEPYLLDLEQPLSRRMVLWLGIQCFLHKEHAQLHDASSCMKEFMSKYETDDSAMLLLQHNVLFQGRRYDEIIHEWVETGKPKMKHTYTTIIEHMWFEPKWFMSIHHILWYCIYRNLSDTALLADPATTLQKLNDVRDWTPHEFRDEVTRKYIRVHHHQNEYKAGLVELARLQLPMRADYEAWIDDEKTTEHDRVRLYLLAIRMLPNDYELRLELACSYQQQSAIQEAIDQCSTVLRMFREVLPVDVLIHTYRLRASLYHAIGQSQLAVVDELAAGRLVQPQARSAASRVLLSEDLDPA